MVDVKRFAMLAPSAANVSTPNQSNHVGLGAFDTLRRILGL